MGKAFLYRYKVYNVPLLLQPVFYLYSYFVALILLGYALIVHFTSKIEIMGQERLDAQREVCHPEWGVEVLGEWLLLLPPEVVPPEQLYTVLPE